MSRGTPDTSSYFHISPTGLSPSLITFPICSAILSSDYEVLYPIYISICRFGLFPFRSPLLGESFAYFLFLRVLRCFSSPGSPCQAMYSLDNTCPATGEFPHSDICGSRLICSSPQLFAACHVLLRRLVPRHPPYALRSLIVFLSINPFRTFCFCPQLL